MRLVLKGIENKRNGAKAQNVKDINCPTLKGGAIEYQVATGL
jgi:hypothetical protein